MEKKYIKRLLEVPNRSFFLFGPRGVGKSTWLEKTMQDALFFNLLDSSLYLELSQNPANLEALAGNIPEGSWIVIDEIQKIPTLLDEVHRLMEKKRWRFALCGSSARKLRRGGVNLLGGRAITRHLDAFSYAADTLDSYVNTYIKEEIKEEGIIRRIPPFLRFLKIAGQLNGQLVNAQNISSEAMVPRSTVDTYFSILEDTLLGHFLPAYRPNVKVREQTHPKFYWFDPGAARSAAGLLFDPVDRLWQGTALETMIYHELRVFNHTRNRNREIFFYRTANGAEIDFVIETRKRQPSSVPHLVCIEVKLAEKWKHSWERAMRSLQSSTAIEVDRMIGVYTGQRTYHFNGLDVLPVEEFLKRLYQGNIF
jgi:predicted AAA+ superfamily ATPase